MATKTIRTFSTNGFLRMVKGRTTRSAINWLKGFRPIFEGGNGPMIALNRAIRKLSRVRK